MRPRLRKRSGRSSAYRSSGAGATGASARSREPHHRQTSRSPTCGRSSRSQDPAMRQFARAAAVLLLGGTLMIASPSPANAGVVSGALHIATGVGGTILSIGKGVLCKGLSVSGTVAQGATTVGGAALGAAGSDGAATAGGAAAGSVIGGVLKKGIGLVGNVICSSGGGAGSTLAKAALGAVAAAATFDLAAHWMIGAATKITGAIVSMIANSASPQLTAVWFQRSFAPMAALGAALALLVTLIALTSAAARRDPVALAGTLRDLACRGRHRAADRAHDARAADIRRDLRRRHSKLAPDVLVGGRARVGIQRLWRLRILGASDAHGGHPVDRRRDRVARASRSERRDLPRGSVLSGGPGGLDLAEPCRLGESPRPAAVPVRDPQTGHADRPRVCRERCARRSVAQRKPRLVGGHDYCGDHDIRARRDGAVGTDADRRGRLGVRDARHGRAGGGGPREERRRRHAGTGWRQGARRCRPSRRRARRCGRRDPRGRGGPPRRWIAGIGRILEQRRRPRPIGTAGRSAYTVQWRGWRERLC